MAGSHRILVVDNEKFIVRAIRQNLILAGFEVLEAFDGREALEMIERERPDLCILDVMMPQLNGWDVLSCIRDDPEVADLPVIMLTAMTNDADQRTGILRGADVYLTKPFEPRDLVNWVKRLLGEDDD